MAVCFNTERGISIDTKNKNHLRVNVWIANLNRSQRRRNGFEIDNSQSDKAMKSLNKSLFSFFLFTFAFVFTANAQQSATFFSEVPATFDVAVFLAEEDEIFPAVNNYVLTPPAERDADWWGEVEREVSVAGENYKKVTAQDIRHILHFEVNYEGKVDMTSSVSTLLDVHLYHKSEPLRIMALAAIIEIGDEKAINHAHEMLYRQLSQRVVDYSILALQSYYNG